MNYIFKEIKDGVLYNIKTKWEIELDNKITEGDWKQSLKENLRTKQSPYWQQYAWKISMQYFITPGVSSKYNDLSSGCWRSCTHIL